MKIKNKKNNQNSKSNNLTELIFIEKSKQRFQAIQLFENKVSIAQIAKDLGRSRLTIYRWLDRAHIRLSSREKRVSKKVEPSVENRIIEAFILFKRPSMKELSSLLETYYAIRLHPAKLRRFLITKNLFSWKPSALFESILKFRSFPTSEGSAVRAASGEESAAR